MAHTAMYAEIVDGVIVFVFYGTTEDSLYVEVPIEARQGDAFIDSVLYSNPAGASWQMRNARVWVWGGLDSHGDPVWNIDLAAFMPFFAEKVTELRDGYLAARHEFTTAASVTGYFKNDQQTTNAIAAYNRAVNAKNDALYSVDFKAQNLAEEVLYVNLTGEDIKNLDDSLTDRMKLAFDAEKYVRDIHAVTPYENLDAVEIDFNTQVGV